MKAVGILKCEDCSTEKPDAEKTFCPVSMFVNGKIVEVILCDDCHNKRLNDRDELKPKKD